MNPLLRHLRSNAVAYLALMIALGGTSYAASSIPRHSIGTKQLKKNAVTSAQVKNKSLKVVDLSGGAVKSLRGKTGPQGIQGIQGPKGDAGPAFAGFGQNTTNGAMPGDGIVSDLAGSNGGTGSGVLTLPVKSRVYINGYAQLSNISATEPVRARCTAEVSAGGATALDVTAGPNSFMDIHQADTDSTGSVSQLHESLAVAGSALLEPGTYNIGIVCAQIGSTGTGTVNRFTSAVNVIGVPSSS